MYELTSNYGSKKRSNKFEKENDKWYYFLFKSLKNKFLFFVKILIIVFISILLITTFHFESIGSTETELIEVKIVKGDTLWKIAARHYDKNTDLRKKIFEIKKVNELESAMLKPGQIIKIPISK